MVDNESDVSNRTQKSFIMTSFLAITCSALMHHVVIKNHEWFREFYGINHFWKRLMLFIYEVLSREHRQQ